MIIIRVRGTCIVHVITYISGAHMGFSNKIIFGINFNIVSMFTLNTQFLKLCSCICFPTFQ